MALNCGIAYYTMAQQMTTTGLTKLLAEGGYRALGDYSREAFLYCAFDYGLYSRRAIGPLFLSLGGARTLR